MATIRPEFHSTVVSQILDEIFYQRSSYYYFLGKIAPWVDEETPPEAPINSLYDDVVIRDNILYLRRIQPNDVSLVTTGYVWTSGQVYDHWDDHIDMSGLPFYVVTSEYNVYKCLDNNGSAVSTVMPTTNSLFPFRTSDGYLWKYMYNIPTFKRSKFQSRGFIPVQKALTDSFYNKGAVESIVVTDQGSGYTDAQLTTITVSGTTSGSGATADIVSVGPLGEITSQSISVISGGTAYTNGAAVSINSFTGTGAIVEPVIVNNVITGFAVIDGGSGYSTNDTVSITVGGAVLQPIVSRTTGEITQVKIINSGAGYNSTVSLSIQQTPASGTGKYGNSGAVIKPILYNGSIVNVTIEDPGVDYPADTATTVVVSGDGSGAVLTPVIYEGKVIEIIVENTGIGYTYMNLSIEGSGTGAKATAVLATSDFLSDQSQVEQVAVRGAIYSCVITNPGNNYSTESELVVTGDGTGAAGTVTVVDGEVTKITMTSYGQGYTYANLSIYDKNRSEPNNFDNMEAYAILPPPQGHGFDAVNELYGDVLCIFNLIKGDTELNLIAQDYRQYGLLQNPTNIFTNKRVTENTNIVTFKVKVADVLSMQVDDVLVCNNKRYRVVTIEDTTIEVQQLCSIYGQPSGFFYDELDPVIQYGIQRIDEVPTLNKYSGNLLYVTNNTPFTPTSEQTIAIRTYIKI